jgi:hypothetical protein
MAFFATKIRKMAEIHSRPLAPVSQAWQTRLRLMPTLESGGGLTKT